ncbi:PREDICTED: uncharacterized protein LOC107352473 isoform X2 [Acropora digitifera]|uniref:uncharacterized protein LOC107352473 isoform X2 n=1 Tax=Acropora digitifera TaxID=70779 RepID=UPI00077AC494|nr:PREDICTED: uncharacterized protein LOC107352473 isoform X2 [Acropora digitifera]
MSFSCSSGSGPDNTRQDKLPHDITSKQGLTDLYNSGVVSVEHVTRPLGGSVGIKHSGVVLTTSSGDRWLVHKGSGYGDSSQTVVTNAKHMSGAWKSAGTQPAKPETRVADYVKAGGSEYNLATDNCHHGSRRMMDVAKPK